MLSSSSRAFARWILFITGFTPLPVASLGISTSALQSPAKVRSQHRDAAVLDESGHLTIHVGGNERRSKQHLLRQERPHASFSEITPAGVASTSSAQASSLLPPKPMPQKRQDDDRSRNTVVDTALSSLSEEQKHSIDHDDGYVSHAGSNTATTSHDDKDYTDAKDPLGCWGAANRSRLLLGGPLDLNETKTMLNSFADSVVTLPDGGRISKSAALSMKVPRCSRYDAASILPSISHMLTGTDADDLKAYLDKHLHGLDRTQPLIMASIEGFQLPHTTHPLLSNPEQASRSELCLNFICGMQRLGLEKRLVVFAVDEATNKSLNSLGNSILVLHHPALLAANAIAQQRTQVSYQNRMAKLVLPLLLVERGFPVIVTDIDTYWIRDPTPYLLGLGKDLAAMSDSCPNDLNSGFVFYSGSAKSKDVLRLALSIKKWRNQTHQLYTANDQYLLECAHAQALVHAGLKSTVLPRPAFTFGSNKEGFVNFNCRENEAVESASPFVWHTAGTSGKEVIGTVQMLKSIGFWDVQPDVFQDQAANKSQQRMAGQLSTYTKEVALMRSKARRASNKQAYCSNREITQEHAKHLGHNACLDAWHPRCHCKANDFAKLKRRR